MAQVWTPTPSKHCERQYDRSEAARILLVVRHTFRSELRMSGDKPTILHVSRTDATNPYCEGGCLAKQPRILLAPVWSGKEWMERAGPCGRI
jgi:hypothetical protein